MSDLTGGRDVAPDSYVRRQNAQAPRMRADGARNGMDYTPPERTNAFKAADRHTARVRFLRRAIVIGAVLLCSVIAMVVAFNPLRHLPGSVSIAGVGIEGSKITMDRPKISGVQQGGGSYQIEAKKGIQDITTPSLIDLVGVDAHVGMSDHTTTHILANDGIYNNKVDTMALSGNVHIANTSGYVLALKTALISFRDGVFSSNERSTVNLQGGSVSADHLVISNNGHVIAFRDHISSTFDPPADDSNADDSKGADQTTADTVTPGMVAPAADGADR